MTSSYYQKLLKKVIDNSNEKKWEEAVLEWDITDWAEDEEFETSCICGKENIRYLFTITNRKNGRELEPIGSSCIKKFKRDDLDNETALFEQLFKLQKALSNKKFINLSSDYFSRKLLKYFYEKGIFNSEYNSYNGKNDYEFMCKMFNKRNKENITPKQQEKINAIIIFQIIPYLKDLL
ncbi:transcriptional regulator [Carnobacterium divergens]|uniref:transcriptional regulator n=1 Tax=Carnobacterium divergens TaxID=2748 RepID=UPI0010728114|nr:transcriptional regulator [Carnobacterium divergens]TFI72247.1 transcriptional regulator [Carnobacterium divergens]